MSLHLITTRVVKKLFEFPNHFKFSKLKLQENFTTFSRIVDRLETLHFIPALILTTNKLPNHKHEGNKRSWKLSLEDHKTKTIWHFRWARKFRCKAKALMTCRWCSETTTCRSQDSITINSSNINCSKCRSLILSNNNYTITTITIKIPTWIILITIRTVGIRNDFDDR